MRTRSKSAAASRQSDAPELPEVLQIRILSFVAEHYSRPDDQEYAIYPYKTSFCWLTSLLRVSRSWRQHLSKDPNYVTRSRLEALTRIGLWHDYIHIFRGSKKKKHKLMPKTVLLPFVHCPAVECSIQKHLTTAEKTGGLTSHSLILRMEACRVSSTVLLQLLLDQVLLDAHYTTPFVLKIVEESTCVSCKTPQAPRYGEDAQQQLNQPPDAASMNANGPGEGTPAASTVVGTVANMGTAGTTSSSISSRLDALASVYHDLQESPHLYIGGVPGLEVAAVKALVLEKGRGQALYFIPTLIGFRRRLGLQEEQH